MAPTKGGMKRPAAAAAEVEAPASKRGRGSRAPHVDPVLAPKLDSISEALQKNEAFPAGVRAVLITAVKHCLCVNKSDRHELMHEYVNHMSTILESLKVSMEEETAKHQAVIDSVDTTKVAMATEEKETADKLEELKAASTAAKAAADADQEAVGVAAGALAAAKKARDEGDVAFNQLEKQKLELETTLNEIFLPMKTKLGEPKELKQLEKVCKAYNFDASMMESVQSVLKMEPEKRGSFAGMVASQLEEGFNTRITDIASKMSEEEPGKTSRAAEVEAKETELESAKTKATASKEAWQGSKEAQAEAAKELANKTKAIANFLPEMKKAADQLDDAKAAYEEFISGPMQAFTELKELAPPAPEPPAPEPEPEVAECGCSLIVDDGKTFLVGVGTKEEVTADQIIKEDALTFVMLGEDKVPCADNRPTAMETGDAAPVA